jgi:hypothetical protein
MRSLRLQSNGLLPDTSFVSYLRWRRSLNPRRFDANHPNIAQLIIRDEANRPPITPTVVRPPTINPRPQPLEPPKVPEPSGIAVAGVLVAAGILASRRERWRRSTRSGSDATGSG